MRRADVQAIVGSLFLSLVCGLGCGRFEDTDEGELIHLVDESAEIFEPGVLFETREVFSWDLSDPAEVARWQLVGDAVVATATPDGLSLPAVEKEVRLSRRLDGSETDVQFVAVTLAGGDATRVRVCWASQGEIFSNHRCATRWSGGPRYELDLPRTLTAPIERLWLAITPQPSPESDLLVGEIDGTRWEVDPRRLPEAMATGWKVTLKTKNHRETRSAWIAAPGAEKSVSVEVPEEGSILRFGYGVEHDLGTDLEFHVSARWRGGEEPVRLFDERIAVGSRPGWRDGRIDLARFADHTVELIFTVSNPDREAPLRLEAGLAFWSFPELVVPNSLGEWTNVVLVSIDTLRPDHLSLFGYERETSPGLDSWARRCGVTFETTVAPAPWTVPSHASLFTGLDALSHGVNHVTQLPGSLLTLAERLRAEGYATGAVTGGGYLTPELGFSQGFDRFITWRRGTFSELELERGMDRAMLWLEKNRGTPFLLFFHTYEVHTPYRVREPYYSRLAERAPARRAPVSENNRNAGKNDGFVVRRQWIWQETQGDLRNGAPLRPDEFQQAVDRYDSGIAYMDTQLSRLFRYLRELDLMNNTVVVVTSDHGESLGEPSPTGESLTGHAHLYDSNLLVPLIISLPACEQAGRRVTEQVRTVDVAPTVLDAVGLAPTREVDGVSLTPLLFGRPASSESEAWSYAAFSNLGVSLRIDNRTKLIFNNSLWDAVRGQEEILVIPESGRRSSGAAPNPDLVQGFHTRLRQRFESMPGTIRLHFHNDTNSEIRTRLSGELVPTRLKSFQLPAGRVDWSRSRLEVTVGPGESFEITVENPKQETIQIEPLTPKGSTVILDPSAATEQALTYDGSSWRLTDTWTHAPAAVRASWTGASLDDRGSGGDPLENDEEIMEQLRELGYVD